MEYGQAKIIFPLVEMRYTSFFAGIMHPDGCGKDGDAGPCSPDQDFYLEIITPGREWKMEQKFHRIKAQTALSVRQVQAALESHPEI
jgi:hypothetical protein